MYLASFVTVGAEFFEIVASIILGVFAIGIIFYLLMIIAGWRILKKAGQPGWKILIPIYNVYMLWKIAGMKNWFWFMVGLSIVASILEAAAHADLSVVYDQFYAEGTIVDTTPMTIVALVAAAALVVCATIAQLLYAYRTSKVFGHGIGYTIGLIFLTTIFWLILGFGSSDYDKRRLYKATADTASRSSGTKSVAAKSSSTKSTKSSTKKTTTKSKKS